MRKKRRSGFTLVELMVVAIIVAILAAVAIPLMSGSKRRAMATEAEAGLGTCRTALRAYFAEHNDYGSDGVGKPVTDIEGIRSGDLSGTYFTDGDYTYTVYESGSNYTLYCSGSTGDVVGVSISLNRDGEFIRSGL